MSYGAAGFGDDTRRRWDHANSTSPATVNDAKLYSYGGVGESSSSNGLRSLESGSSAGSMRHFHAEQRSSSSSNTPVFVIGHSTNGHFLPAQQAGSAPKSSPLFDCVNPAAATTPMSSRSSEGESSYFRSQAAVRPPVVAAIDKQLPSLPPDEVDPEAHTSFSEQMDTSFDSRLTNRSNTSAPTPDIRYPIGQNHERSPEHTYLNGNESAVLKSRLSPSWNAAKNAFGKTTKSRNRSSPNSSSPTLNDDNDLIGLGVRSGEGEEAATQSSHVWANRAGAVKAAGQSAGSGLMKWGKASAAKLKQAQQLGKDASPLLGGWAKGSGGGLKRYDGRAAKSAADLTTSSDADFAPPMPMLPTAMPDPRIGLPTDVRHNVHVDVGPQGYTGLPVSWAQVLAQHGMNAEDVRRDPQSALEVIRERTQYFVDQEAERGQDPEQTKKVLESRLGQLEHLEEAREAVRSATPGPTRTRHSQDNVTRSDATVKRESTASTTYSSVLNQGWPASPTWSDAPSLPKLKKLDNGPSPILPNVEQGEEDDDWGASLLRALPKSSSSSSGLYDRRRSRSLESRLAIPEGNKEPQVARANLQRGNDNDADDHADDQEEMAEDMEMASIHTASKISAIKITRSSISSASLSHDAAAALRLMDRRESAGSSSLRHHESSEARSSSIASRSVSPSNDDSAVRSIPSSATAASSASNNLVQGLSATSGNVRPPSASSSAASELSAHVMNGLRERRKHSPRIYPPSTSKFVGKEDAPSPRSIGFKPSAIVNNGVLQTDANRQSNMSAQLSDGSHSLDRPGGESPVFERARGTTPDFGKKASLQDQIRNSGASVRLASTPLQTYLRTESKDSGESTGLQAPRDPRPSSGQATPDLILPDADGFFRPSSTNVSSPSTYSPTFEKSTGVNASYGTAPSIGNASTTSWQKSHDIDTADAVEHKADGSSHPSDGTEDYQPASDFLDDWLNGEGGSDEEDEMLDDESISPTVSSKARSQKRSVKRVPPPLKTTDSSSHQSPSPALLLGLPTPLRAQFQTSLGPPPLAAASVPPVEVAPPVSPQQTSSLLLQAPNASVQEGNSPLRAQRDWRARSLPPPPEEDVDETSAVAGEEKSSAPALNKMVTESSEPLRGTSYEEDKNVVTRASSRASRASSRAGRRSLRRRSSDARRFPVSMHYASGFDTDTLTTDPEAINSFAELMRSRQSLDLDDVMPMDMAGGHQHIPPVPAVPGQFDHVGGTEQRGVREIVERYSLDFLPAQAQALQPFLRTEKPKDVLGELVLIGEGESGNVYSSIPRSDCAIPSLAGRGKVAIKIITLGANATEDEDQRKSRQIRLTILSQELTLWRDGGKQANIVSLYDVFFMNERPGRSAAVYIVQEFMSISLADIITLKDAGLTIEERHMARITKDVCLALKHLHARTIVHRDVRSDNILLNFDGKAKLSDFTHATSIASSKRTSTVGTAYWMAPEVINAEAYDTQADMWSLGAVLFEMAEGDPPRVELPALRAIALTTSAGMPPLSEPNRWSNAFKKCLAWCTQMSAAERATATQLLQDPFVAASHSYESLADLVENARSLEADTLSVNEDDEEIVVEHRSPSLLRAALPPAHMRDSWTSQSTVHA